MFKFGDEANQHQDVAINENLFVILIKKQDSENAVV